jgi:hypothetical protein
MGSERPEGAGKLKPQGARFTHDGRVSPERSLQVVREHPGGGQSRVGPAQMTWDNEPRMECGGRMKWRRRPAYSVVAVVFANS